MPTTISDLEKSVNSALTTAIKTSKICFNQLYLEIDIDNLYSTILKILNFTGSAIIHGKLVLKIPCGVY